ncbi:hypothetical protein Zmor_026449 [Zophobas morio]|uniref:Uncharacterized protein n=1 Tax=Zophobas morio TaxID=2755281 RepID=A0AA38M4G7_9CUCU|nr:hypothetical protein Zmor_026449 [Zophobas morio]
MDFTSYIRDQNEKLHCRDYVFHLWEELEGINSDGDISANAINDFNNHLPVLLEQFWEIALEKLNMAEELDEIDEELKVYLLILIYQCITQSHELISYKCVLYAAEVYLHLLTTPQRDEFYKSKLYRITISTVESSLEAVATEHIANRLMFKLRKFLVRAKLTLSDLEVTLATLIHIMFIKSKEVFHDFEMSNHPQPIALESLLSLKVLYEQELIQSRKFIIMTYLFNGLRKHNAIHTTPRHFNIIQLNFRNLFKSLHQKFKEERYKTFLNAFIHIWKHPDFTFFGEAVFIMNGLKEKYYRTLLDILNKMMMTKNPHKNLFKLALSIICYPPKYVPTEKVKVTNEILLKQILLNCLSSKSEVSNNAVESLAEILMSPDLEKEYIKTPMKAILNCSNNQNMNVPMMLRGLQTLMSKKWGTRSKNKNLLVIVVSVMLFCEEDHPEMYREVLDFLTEQCTPYDVKPFLPLLSQTYLTLTHKNQKFSALQLLKIIFKMALHPMASSTEFVKYLYTAMIYPNVCKGMPVKSEIFIDPIISDDFHFSEFFEKCHTLGLIRNDHITKLIGNLSNINESNMKLLCALVHLTEYKELSVIADHINDNFTTICNRADLTHLFYIYNKIYKNAPSRSNQSVRCNEIMVCFIKHHLLRQSFRWNCVANAFSLLKTLEDFTNLEEDFALFKEQYDRMLAAAVQTRGSFLPLVYYCQLIIFGRVIPSEENLKAVTDFLSLCTDEFHSRSADFNPKLWIGCLLLYTNICVVKTNLVETALDYLQCGLNSSVTVVKLAAINMTFDLCNMVTHNFEDVIRYMFKQLVFGDNVFKKTCLMKIDRLIRDDYLKLELEQFIIFVSVLADRHVNLSDYAKQLLSENFFMSNPTLIARYFVPLIVHINGYRKHPNYRISNNGYELAQLISRSILDRRKMYDLLFNSLPIKHRFTIIYLLSTHILENMMKSRIKVDDGFWKMIKDSIYIFKLLTSNSNEDEPGENFYKKVAGHISKFLLQKSEYPDKSLYPEYHKEIMQGTETLIRLLSFNDNNNIQKHISISVFDAIIHWTNFLMADLVHIIHVERSKEIQSCFSKFDKFYKKNGQNLRYAEDSFESGGGMSTDTPCCSRSLFNVPEEYIPDFDTS